MSHLWDPDQTCLCPGLPSPETVRSAVQPLEGRLPSQSRNSGPACWPWQPPPSPGPVRSCGPSASPQGKETQTTLEQQRPLSVFFHK